MSYLYIKEDDSKLFKAFLSGNEIEVGVFVSTTSNTFGAGNHVEIFYGDENNDTYTAQIKKQLNFVPLKEAGKGLLRLSLVKV